LLFSALCEQSAGDGQQVDIPALAIVYLYLTL